MKNKATITVVLFTAMLLLTSCSAIEGIFKAGMGFGVFIAIAAVAVLIFIITRFTKKE